MSQQSSLALLRDLDFIASYYTPAACMHGPRALLALTLSFHLVVPLPRRPIVSNPKSSHSLISRTSSPLSSSSSSFRIFILTFCAESCWERIEIANNFKTHMRYEHNKKKANIASVAAWHRLLLLLLMRMSFEFFFLLFSPCHNFKTLAVHTQRLDMAWSKKFDTIKLKFPHPLIRYKFPRIYTREEMRWRLKIFSVFWDEKREILFLRRPSSLSASETKNWKTHHISSFGILLCGMADYDDDIFTN